MLFAAPLSSASLPIMAPKASTMVMLPSVLPIPLFIDAITFNIGIPSISPVAIEAIRSDSIGLIFRTIRTNRMIIPARTYRKSMLKV